MGCTCFERNEEPKENKPPINKEKDIEIKNKLNILKKSLCIINDSKIGFLCKFPTKENNNFIPVLITRNNNNAKKDTSQEKEIKLLVNQKEYNILIDEKRKNYINNYNLTIIEMKEELDVNAFLEVDNNNINNNQDIYLIYNSPQKKINYSKGKIVEINKNGFEFNYNYNPKIEKSIFSPIINLKNHKVIGISIMNNEKDNINKGALINSIISRFFESQNKKQININIENNNKDKENKENK